MRLDADRILGPRARSQRRGNASNTWRRQQRISALQASQVNFRDDEYSTRTTHTAPATSSAPVRASQLLSLAQHRDDKHTRGPRSLSCSLFLSLLVLPSTDHQVSASSTITHLAPCVRTTTQSPLQLRATIQVNPRFGVQ
ncbi:hypothetical protein BDZ90DRAFT_115539 [Jaminaea rosea]|uniref:Uncharacterized protein n=1 Tax=Jaminaea rosea TaxID=1569628 RepID=A0A316UWL6_9BASI|nr:hypothetical protein BDZ90DRAFT_115539 [Jaminaea rosea]PWN29622.1 hypothetical protein BDZ90DRAFT_115539 [Jaminaea rosea]